MAAQGPVPPSCTTADSMPIKALAVLTWEFCVSWRADDCRLILGSFGLNAVKGLASHVINLQFAG